MRTIAVIAVLALVFSCGRGRRRPAPHYTPPPAGTPVPPPTSPPTSFSNCQYSGMQQVVCHRRSSKRFCYAGVFCPNQQTAFVFCEAVPLVGGEKPFGCPPSADACAAAPDVYPGFNLSQYKRCGSGGGGGGGSGDRSSKDEDYQIHDIDNKR